jgi:transmembrane sensor
MPADDISGKRGDTGPAGTGRSENIDELIIRWLQGQASAAESDALREWRRSSPVREHYCRELERTWQLTAAPPPRGTPTVVPPPAAASIIARAAEASRRARFRRLRRWVPWGILAAATVIGGFLGIRLTGGRSGAAVPLSRVLTTGASELATVTLDDGTVVRLGPNTTLRVARVPTTPALPATPASRALASQVVFLSGRAFFAVAHHQGRSFRVQTDAGDVEVTGTRFAVETHGRSMRTLVLQGTVAAIAGGQRTLVRAGQVGQVTDGDAPQIGDLGDVYGDIDDWVGDLISFEATPLDEVVHELGRHYHTRVTLSDGALAQRTVTASFTDWTLPAVLTSICEVADVQCTTGPAGVTISPRDTTVAPPARAGGHPRPRSRHRQPS